MEAKAKGKPTGTVPRATRPLGLLAATMLDYGLEIVGIAKVSKAGIKDPSDPEGKWAAVKVKPARYPAVAAGAVLTAHAGPYRGPILSAGDYDPFAGGGRSSGGSSTPGGHGPYKSRK